MLTTMSPIQFIFLLLALVPAVTALTPEQILQTATRFPSPSAQRGPLLPAVLTIFTTIALASWRGILSMNPTRSNPFVPTQTSLASWIHAQLLRVFLASVGDPGLYLTSSVERHRLACLPASELVRPFDFGQGNRNWLGSIRAGYVDHMAGMVRRLLAALEARYLAEQSLASAVAALETANKRITDLEAAIHLITADPSVARPGNTIPIHEPAAPPP